MSDSAVAWRRARAAIAEQRLRPDAQNVLARLDAAVDRLEGAYQRLEDFAPLLEAYVSAIQQERR